MPVVCLSQEVFRKRLDKQLIGEIRERERSLRNLPWAFLRFLLAITVQCFTYSVSAAM